MTHPALAPRKSRLVVVPLCVVVLLAVAWTAAWFWAASTAEARITRWREQEARLGRVYGCATQTIGGYPFRIEVRCAEPGLELRGAEPPIVARAKEAVFVAQVYQPTLLIGEVTGPLTIAQPDGPALLVANWRLAQMSFRGLPSAPERISVALDGLAVDRPVQNGSETLATADHLELHARIVAGTALDNPLIDLAVRFTAAAVPGASPLAARPFDGEMTALLRGLRDLKPKPLPVRLKEFQGAGGQLEITKARLQQGETIAATTGALGLSGRGRLDGTVRITIAGLDQFIAANGGLEKVAPMLGLDRTTQGLGGLDRLGPVLGGLDRFAAALGGGARERAQLGLLGLIGEPTDLDGKRAVALPLRFTDGRAFLGPIPLGDTRPVF